MIDETERHRIEQMRQARFECFVDESAGLEDENPFAFDRAEDDPDYGRPDDGPE